MKNTSVNSIEFNNLNDESKFYIIKSIYSISSSIAKQTYKMRKCMNKYYAKGIV